MKEILLQKRSFNSSKQERKHGLVPGIIYGKKCSNLLFEIGELELNSIINEVGEHGIIDVDFEGENYNVLIKDIQKNSLDNKIIHIDLENISNKDINQINTEVPISFSGEELLRKKGHVTQKEKDSVKVKCNKDNIPRTINVDLGSIKPGQAVRLSDLEVAEDITFIENLDTIVVSTPIN